MIFIQFSQTEVRILRGIGKLRYEITSQQGVEMKQDTKKDPVQICIDGVITEYAVAKFLNLHFDLNCDYRKFGADLISHSGAAIDVKSTTTIGGNLNATKRSVEKPADFFVLTEIRPTQVAICGWIERERFLIDENLKNVNNGLFYSIAQSKLNNFYEIRDKEALW
jgi:hypothetical protein